MKSLAIDFLENCEINTNIKYSNRELLTSYRLKKDINARNELIINNMGLVYKAAKKRSNVNSSFAFEDLVQEGVIGMMKGIEKFDLNKNTSFSTYIYYWITHQMDRAIMNNGRLIRLPAHIWEKVNQINQIENENQSLNKEINPNSVPEEIKMDEKLYNDINFYRKTYNSFVSLNTTINLDNEDSYVELQDFIPSDEPSIEEIIVEKDLKENLNKALNTLSPREKEILALRFGFNDNEPKTLEEIGEKYHLTRERIRQIESKAINKIKCSSNKNILQEYLSCP
ncbi:MAG: RNA polymerase sigma factor RpoD [Sporanaerobacter sp.]|jgi:RNA polymerase primary sigma factor|uniref:sigma-70 family RNA polymerase sigma factor n=1 Tax=Sporanaerobacter sp. TaxID=2010183 RepID=UPI003A0FBF94